jgi:flagellin
MSSLVTNSSAMVALKTLRNINSESNKVQNSVATGKTVNTAKDNAAFWAISARMDSDVKGFKAVNESLAFADAAVNVARAGAETTVDLLKEMKAKFVAARDGTADGATIQEDVVALQEQIQQTIDASQFNGINLLTKTTDTEFLASLNRTGATAVTQGEITVTEQNTALDASLTTILAWDATTAAGAEAALTAIEAEINTFSTSAADLGSAGKRIELQREFNSTVMDALKEGIGSIVDTNMEEASARLQALQVQQQLGIQALTVANQAPQNLLQLFR